MDKRTLDREFSFMRYSETDLKQIKQQLENRLETISRSQSSVKQLTKKKIKYLVNGDTIACFLLHGSEYSRCDIVKISIEAVHGNERQTIRYHSNGLKGNMVGSGHFSLKLYEDEVFFLHLRYHGGIEFYTFSPQTWRDDLMKALNWEIDILNQQHQIEMEKRIQFVKNSMEHVNEENILKK